MEPRKAAPDGFKHLGTLGTGSYSVVTKVLRQSDGKVYALKRVKIRKLDKREQKNTLNEIRILASINHPNVVEYREAFIDPKTNDLCIILEYLGGGDMFQKIKKLKKRSLWIPENTIWKYIGQLVRGLGKLHGMGIMHRDLKSANIFISEDMKIVKLGDLNVSKVAEEKLAHT